MDKQSGNRVYCNKLLNYNSQIRVQQFDVVSSVHQGGKYFYYFFKQRAGIAAISYGRDKHLLNQI